MNLETALVSASQYFVRKEHRERFIHEATRKPEKLMARVCHQIDQLFEDRFSGKTCAPCITNECIIFTLTGRMKISTWSEALEIVERGGGGFLVIDETGKHFLAQSEGFPPPSQFAGDA